MIVNFKYWIGQTVYISGAVQVNGNIKKCKTCKHVEYIAKCKPNYEEVTIQEIYITIDQEIRYKVQGSVSFYWYKETQLSDNSKDAQKASRDIANANNGTKKDHWSSKCKK
jgi:hypothetical protein